MAPLTLTRKAPLYSASQWLADADDADALRARRVRAADTTASALQLQLLGEIFPSLERDALRDVLVAAAFRVDEAAALLGELSRERSVSGGDQPALCFHELHGEEDAGDDADDDWSEVAAVSGATDQWVVVQDEWEVLDAAGDRVRSFAEVLASGASGEQQPLGRLPRLAVVEQAPVKMQALKAAAPRPAEADDAELCVKSFGARRRHLLKHHRR